MALTYLAEIHLNPDVFDAAREAVAGIVLVTRAEKGCEAFEPHPAADGSATLHIYERWVDKAAFDLHHAQPYTRAVFAQYENWLAGPIVMTELADRLA